MRTQLGTILVAAVALFAFASVMDSTVENGLLSVPVDVSSDSLGVIDNESGNSDK